MDKDLGTINVRNQTMSRDFDALRQRYIEHKQQLERLASEAPTETLAQRYRQVMAEIDAAIQKLAEMERGTEPATGAPILDQPELGGRRTSPGVRPLRTDPQTRPLTPVVPVERTGFRTVMILLVGVLVLVLLGYFVWRYATGDDEPEIATTTNITETQTTATVAPPPPRAVLSADPLTQDYGVVRKGTRATRQFELLNRSDQPLTVRAERSQCRCLWFEYADTVPPQGSSTMTVTVDGAKAPAGPLHETVQIVSKTDPSISTTFEVVAEIQ